MCQEEELCQVPDTAEQCLGCWAGRRGKLLVPEPEGEGGQVLVGHAQMNQLLLSLLTPDTCSS